MSMGAMLDMMQRMMGKNPGQGQGEQKGPPGDQAGEGQEGDSDSPNKEFTDAGKGKKEERTIGKKSRKGRIFPTT
jgi:hypothetical protein